MEQYLGYANHIEANEQVITWVKTTLSKHLSANKPPTEEVEHILDYIVQANKNTERMTYAQAHKLAEAWTKAQQKKGQHIKETSEDTYYKLAGGKFVEAE